MAEPEYWHTIPFFPCLTPHYLKAVAAATRSGRILRTNSSSLAVLGNGIVNSRREGQSIYYSINFARISTMEKGAKLINGRR